METVSGIGGYCYVNPYPPPAAAPAPPISDRSAKTRHGVARDLSN
jgi:hypothetical protein